MIVTQEKEQLRNEMMKQAITAIAEHITKAGHQVAKTEFRIETVDGESIYNMFFDFERSGDYSNTNKMFVSLGTYGRRKLFKTRKDGFPTKEVADYLIEAAARAKTSRVAQALADVEKQARQASNERILAKFPTFEKYSYCSLDADYNNTGFLTLTIRHLTEEQWNKVLTLIEPLCPEINGK